MNEKALGYVVIFAGFMILSTLSSRWILHMAYESADITPSDIVHYRKVLRKSANVPRILSSWIMEISENPIKTRKLLTIYHLCKLPAVLCMIVAVIGLFTPQADRFLDYASYAVLGFILLMVIIGGFRKNTTNSIS